MHSPIQFMFMAYELNTWWVKTGKGTSYIFKWSLLDPKIKCSQVVTATYQYWKLHIGDHHFDYRVAEKYDTHIRSWASHGSFWRCWFQLGDIQWYNVSSYQESNFAFRVINQYPDIDFEVKIVDQDPVKNTILHSFLTCLITKKHLHCTWVVVVKVLKELDQVWQVSGGYENDGSCNAKSLDGANK